MSVDGSDVLGVIGLVGLVIYCFFGKVYFDAVRDGVREELQHRSHIFRIFTYIVGFVCSLLWLPILIGYYFYDRRGETDG